ncbi:hypothetical protein ANCCAN_23067 [Ancylostoma caninum]|uniref:G-protein coupled receptors family 1 profile domain-containing protein n=1 Tax=Ancylostoma caninum TaxID=29170 RepID=A0A368FJJ6_ANCCA|nr:hypothetical protein ANCCAN_23067 [Ancylostoma caninum]
MKRIKFDKWFQIFALMYCLFGVPLFFGTIAIALYQCVIPLLSSNVCTLSRRFLFLQLVIILYFAWNLLMAVFLYYQVRIVIAQSQYFR